MSEEYLVSSKEVKDLVAAVNCLLKRTEEEYRRPRCPACGSLNIEDWGEGIGKYCLTCGDC